MTKKSNFVVVYKRASRWFFFGGYARATLHNRGLVFAHTMGKIINNATAAQTKDLLTIQSLNDVTDNKKKHIEIR